MSQIHNWCLKIYNYEIRNRQINHNLCVWNGFSVKKIQSFWIRYLLSELLTKKKNFFLICICLLICIYTICRWMLSRPLYQPLGYYSYVLLFYYIFYSYWLYDYIVRKCRYPFYRVQTIIILIFLLLLLST